MLLLGFLVGCGGTETLDAQLVFRAEFLEFQEIPPADEVHEAVRWTFERRLEYVGISAVVSREGKDLIVVELPTKDIAAAKPLLAEVGRLEILERVCLDAGCASHNDQLTGISGRDMIEASVGEDAVTGQPVILFSLDPQAALAFAELTQRISQTASSESPDQLAFALDEKVLVTKIVVAPVLNGRGVFAGPFNREEAERIVAQVLSGSLFVPVVLIEETTAAG